MNKAKDKHILLFGATGKTGAQIYRELRSRNIKLTLFVREESASKLAGEERDIIHGDVLKYEEVEAALKGDSYTDVIISLGSKMIKGAEIRSLGTGHIIKALQSTGAKSKVHVISALGVGDSWNQLGRFGKLISKLLLKSVLEDHRKQEDLVMKD